MDKVKLLRLVLVIITGLMITIFFVVRSSVPTVQGAFGVPGVSSWVVTVSTAVYGFLMTLIGVFVGAAYRRLIELRSKGVSSVRLRSIAKQTLRSIDFHIGLVGSPIVFGLIWQAIGDISVAGITIIALQNGFASHAVLERVVPHNKESEKT